MNGPAPHERIGGICSLVPLDSKLPQTINAQLALRLKEICAHFSSPFGHIKFGLNIHHRYKTHAEMVMFQDCVMSFSTNIKTHLRCSPLLKQYEGTVSCMRASSSATWPQGMCEANQWLSAAWLIVGGGNEHSRAWTSPSPCPSTHTCIYILSHTRTHMGTHTRTHAYT